MRGPYRGPVTDEEDRTQRAREAAVRSRKKNAESLKNRSREYRKRNKEKIAASRRLRAARKLAENPNYYIEIHARRAEKELKYRKSERGAAARRAAARARRQRDLSFRIGANLSTALYKAFRRRGVAKSSLLNLLGCSIDELRSHLQRQFLPGMSWENYGYHGWHIDHIRPRSSFDLTDPDQQKQCFHYTNLQPLWGFDNFQKNSKTDWVLPEERKHEPPRR